MHFRVSLSGCVKFNICAKAGCGPQNKRKCITLHAVHGVYEVSTLYSRSGTRNAHECTLRVNACLSRAFTRRACNVLRGTNLPVPELLFLLAIRADAQSFFLLETVEYSSTLGTYHRDKVGGRYCTDELHAGMHHVPVVTESLDLIAPVRSSPNMKSSPITNAQDGFARE